MADDEATPGTTPPDERERLAQLCVRARAALQVGDAVAALDAASEAVWLAQQLGADEAWTRCLWMSGAAHVVLHEFERAAVVLRQARTRVAHLGDPALLYEVLDSGAYAAFRLSHYEDALQQSREALDLARALGDWQREARALTSVGAALAELSDYKAALEALHAARKRLDDLGRPELGGRACNYVALVHEQLGDFNRALPAYEHAVELLRHAGDWEHEAHALANLGDALMEQREHERATPLLQRAFSILYGVGDYSLAGCCLVSLGRGRAAAGDAAEALRLLQRGVDVTSRGDSKRQQAAALTALGLLQARLGEHGLALDDLHRALGLAEAVQVRREIYQPHEALAEAYERRGDLRAALEHFKAFQRLRSEVWDGVARARLDTLMVEFELEKARQQREIEQLRNVELKRAYEKLQELHAQVARQADELAELAVRDGLTGVYNRRHLDRALQHELARARRYAQPLSVALLDVDEFKHVNDRHSHAVGDLVLRRLAALMAGLVRQSDVIARYGGEEFALVFPGTQLVQAAAACEKVRQAVDALDWSEVAPDLRVTVSVGVAMDPGTLTWDKLLDEADAQLYLAKSQGRNRVCAAGESVG